MKKSLVASMAIIFAAGTLAIAEEYPDPNPAPNGDGTFTWYVGNNTQYPIIQDVLDNCGDGDEVVVAGGLYVESLYIDNNDITIRPFCVPCYEVRGAPGGEGEGSKGDGCWEPVAFWNPTEGFENDNQYAMRITGGNNTYIGRPRLLTQLPNHVTVETMVTPGEWSPKGPPQSVVEVQSNSNEPAFAFLSRSVDDVAVYSDNGLGTFQSCLFTSAAGFGGGAMITGDSNTTQFINCMFEGTTAGGQPYEINGHPVCVITIIGGEPQFHEVGIGMNAGGENGIVYQEGGGGIWSDVMFAGNISPASKGTFICVGGTPTMAEVDFDYNVSREGTIYFDGTGVHGARMFNLIEVNFYSNETVGSQYGGVMEVVCDDCDGHPPMVCFSDCSFDNNNGHTQLSVYDINSPYFPIYRIGEDTEDWTVANSDESAEPADINQDGLVDTLDLNAMFSMLGTCYHDSNSNGNIEVNDLLSLISAWDSYCE